MGVNGDPHRIAILAPPWIPVPPPGYGGIEAVVALLCEELVRRGNEVILFAAPGSRSVAEVRPLLASAHPTEIDMPPFEVDHVARAFRAIEQMEAQGRGIDVVHDHCPCATVAMADRLDVPVVHTVHAPFKATMTDFFACHAPKAGAIVGLSGSQLARAPREVRGARAIPNPIVVDEWPFTREKEDYLLWLGRITPDKGPHRAIAAALAADARLVLAGPVQRGQDQFFRAHVEPHVDGSVRYVGEVGGAYKKQLFARARALLMPIRWPEPFGLVMVEAMACGTPVIAFPEGAARELVIDGETGFLVSDEGEMAGAVERLDEIDPERCRRHVAETCDVGVVASAYEDVYREAVERRGRRGAAPATALGAAALRRRAPASVAG